MSLRHRHARAAPRAAQDLAAKAGAKAPRRALGDISNRGAAPAAPLAAKPAAPPPRRARFFTVDTPEHAEAGMDLDVDLELDLDKQAPPAVDPVDVADVRDAQACVEYIGDIMEGLFAAETRRMPAPDYMDSQADLRPSMRKILVSWLVEVHQRFKLEPDTLHLAVNLLDRYLCARAVSRGALQLIGTACLLVASKVEDIWAPEVRECCRVAAGAFSRDELLAAERDVLKALDFRLVIVSPRVMAQRFAKVAGIGLAGLHAAEYFLELALLHYATIRFRPSESAAAAVYLARRCLDPAAAAWTPALAAHTRHSEEALLPCAREMVAIHVSGDAKHAPVRRKYAAPEYSRATAAADAASASGNLPV